MSENTSAAADGNKKARVIPKGILLPFILVTFLFSLWGFANDITNPMVAAFKNILLISNFQSSLVQFAFYGGYCVMAIPAALFIKRFSYKTGILLGLTLYAVGCLMFIPSGWMMAFWAFLISYFIMTCGLSFLETSANPYILAMGSEDTSTQRLNFSQSFNPMGSITGMLVASQVILVSLNPTTETGRRYIQEVSEGKTYTAQVLTESHGLIKKAQEEITPGEGQQLDAKTLPNALGFIESAKKQIDCLAPERGEKAVGFLAEYIEAEKQSPKLLSKIAGLFRENPQVVAAQKVLDDKNAELAKSFNGDKSELELVAQIYEENKMLSEISPEILNKVQLSVASLATVIQETESQLSTTAEAFEPGASGSESLVALKESFSQIASSIEATGKTLETVPSEALASWYAAASTELGNIQQADLDVIIGPYTILGFVVLTVLIVFAIAKLPKVSGEDDNKINLGPTLSRLFRNRKYIEGVVAQAFYVGAQIMCWTFIIQYAGNELDMPKPTAQNYNIVAMAIFVSSRFICTFLLRFFSPGGLLMTLAIAGMSLVGGTIFIKGMTGLYCLIGVSACMSLMFPTIYGIALKGLGDDAKLGAAGLIMAIGGGCLMPPMQAAIMDMDAFNLGFMTLSSARASFVLPLICFIVIAIFGFRTSNVHGHKY